MLDVVGDDLVVIANTGDDVEVYGAHVSPDPDLVTLLARRRASTSAAGACAATPSTSWTALRELGAPTCGSASATATSPGAWSARGGWRDGERLTEAHAALAAALGVTARVLPMSDEPVRTRVRARAARGTPPGVPDPRARRGPGRRRRASTASTRPRPTPEVLEAIAAAARDRDRPVEPRRSRSARSWRVPGMREALRAAPAPVVAVSPDRRRRGAEGPDRRVHGVGRPPARRRRHRRGPTRA